MLDHEEVQAALSARLDGEPAGLDDDVVDAHVAGCDTCRRFWEQSLALSRRLSFVEPVSSGMSPPAELSERIIAGVEPEWRRRSANRLVSLTLARIVAVVLAVALVVWAAALVLDAGGLVPVSGDGQMLGPGAQPEFAALLIEGAALRLALAVGLAFAAWQPSMSAGMAPIVGTLFAFLAGFVVRDLILGLSSATQLAGLVALALAVVVLAWLWIAGRGIHLGQVWRGLRARPN